MTVKFTPPEYITDFDPVMFHRKSYSATTAQTRQAISDILSELPPPPNKKHERHREEATIALVCALYSAWKKGRPLGASLSKRYYRRLVQYTPTFYRFAVIQPLIQELEALGYIQIERGYKHLKTGEGHISKLYCSEKITKFFPVQYDAHRKEVLILRDENKELMEYSDNSFTRNKRKFILQWNEFIQQHEVTLDGERIETDIFSVHSRGDWNLHGRFYGDFQNWPSVDRERILINGQETEEPDFSSLHLALIYDLEGVQLPDGDLYEAILIELGCPPQYRSILRKAAKLMVLTAINAKSPEQAVRSFQHEINRLRWSTRCRPEKQQRANAIYGAMHELGINAPALLEEVRRVHAPVSTWLCSDGGIKLMFIDSEIMRAILSELMRRGIAGLPVHDSIRVPTDRATEVEEIMQAEKERYFEQLKIAS